MNNSKVIFVTVLVLTLLVGGSLGFLIGERTSSVPKRHYHLQKQVQVRPELKAKAARHLARKAYQRKLLQKGKEGEIFLGVLSKKCELTNEQQEEIKEILQSKRSQIQDVRKDIKKKMEHIKEQTEAEIKEVLTKEQKEQFDNLKEEAAKRRKIRRCY